MKTNSKPPPIYHCSVTSINSKALARLRGCALAGYDFPMYESKAVRSALITMWVLFGMAAWATPLMPEPRCLVASEFALAGLRIGDPVEKAIEKLGEPSKETQAFDEYYIDDVTSWAYDDILVTTSSSGRVLMLSTTSPSTSTPSGIQPGLTVDELSGLLGHDIKDKAKMTFGIGFFGCAPKGGIVVSQMMSLKFDLDGNLQEIRLFDIADPGPWMAWEILVNSPPPPPLVVVGVLTVMVAHFSLVIMAFRQRLWWGLGCLLFPLPTDAVFAIMHWRKVGALFLIGVLGVVLLYFSN